jgi:hypothetical protein
VIATPLIHKNLADAPVLVEELQNFRCEVSDTGYLRFNARSGKHDDILLAVSCNLARTWRRRERLGNFRALPPAGGSGGLKRAVAAAAVWLRLCRLGARGQRQIKSATGHVHRLHV